MMLLDTNFLAIPQEFGIDIFEKLSELEPNGELATTTDVIKELENNNKIGKIGMMLVKSSKIKILKSQLRNTDNDLITIAIENDAAICTNDKELKTKAKKRGINVIFMRGKNTLESWR